MKDIIQESINFIFQTISKNMNPNPLHTIKKRINNIELNLFRIQRISKNNFSNDLGLNSDKTLTKEDPNSKKEEMINQTHENILCIDKDKLKEHERYNYPSSFVVDHDKEFDD